MACSGAVSVMRVKPRKSLNQRTASISIGNAAQYASAENALAGVAAQVSLHQRSGHARERHRLDGKREEGRQALQRRDLRIVEPSRRPRRP